MSAASGAVAPSGRSARTRSGAMASMSEVSTRPACASPPGTPGSQHDDPVALAAQPGRRPPHGLRVAAVPGREDHGAEVCRAAHELDDDVLERRLAEGQRAREPGVLAARPVRQGGRGDDVAAAGGRAPRRARPR